jgi:zinc-ribbon domain
MRCPKCLSENVDTSKFCSNCASPLAPPDQPGFKETSPGVLNSSLTSCNL